MRAETPDEAISPTEVQSTERLGPGLMPAQHMLVSQGVGGGIQEEACALT